MSHPKPILPDELSRRTVAYYHIWDGNMCATVTQSVAPYGLCSAAILVGDNTGPLQCIMYDGHATGVPMHLGVGVMRNWIAAKLNQLGTETTRDGKVLYSKPRCISTTLTDKWNAVEIG